ncbi:Dihydrolipoamide acyltransferase component of branched-chain alpha-keto acid dehydrogenase complex [Pseudonocardia sp. Ae717_Ps2]|uniref:lipoyl domain-containing protein n=1 Tax=Pseudonocardia sp. Ae717_Ps2 TaxID=1885573 RepID=UPI00095FB916|nr:lipoyl domain-containing protein [Pseudonocardia sp. Ae717_Ps2]OLM33007.1 Dihydrolipoamide acyltransferase component of branched-chain alpha-keto acid dehydrogenase complex [Pseudonocardia sp. Ae717_Ps2]
MSTDIVMPQLGLTMETGILTGWLVQEGATVAQDDPVAEISTDKVEHELVAPADGVITILRPADDEAELPVGTVLARLN